MLLFYSMAHWAKRHHKRLFFIAILTAAGLTVCSFLSAGGEIFRVVRVVDGNTLRLSQGFEIHLIGVKVPKLYDAGANQALAAKKGIAPEKVKEYARKTREFVEFLVEGQDIRVETEPAHESIQYRDKEDRILSYAWFTVPLYKKVPEWLIYKPNDPTGRFDGFLNAAIIRGGYGVVDPDIPFRYGRQFVLLELEAKRNRRGLWEGYEAPQADSAESPKAAAAG